ncbi:MAG: hypothetical protein U0Y82_16460 [Thermoleophilia bacterium]
MQTAKAPAGASKVYFIDVIGDKTPIDKKHVLLSSVIWNFTQVFQQAMADVGAGTFGQKGYDLTVKNGISLLKTNNAPASAWPRWRPPRRRSPTAASPPSRPTRRR